MKALRNSSRKDIKVRPEKVFSGRRFHRPSSWNIAFALTFAFLAYFLMVRSSHNDIEKPREVLDPENQLPPSQSKLHNFKVAAITSDSQICSNIAKGFLNENIFDTAVALSFCLALTQSSSMGLLGGFLATVYSKESGESFVIDAQAVSPMNFNLTETTNLSLISSGSLSVAVPGFLTGLKEIHKKHGSRSWRSLIEPTIVLCKEGFIVSHHLHNSMLINKHILKDEYLRKELYDETSKRFKQPGSKIILRKFCDFLEVIADNSEDQIFKGKVGDLIFKDFEDAGTLITKRDLIDYKVKWSKPIKFQIRDFEIILPNTGAVLVPAALNVLNQFRINGSSFDMRNVKETVLTYHRVVETLKHIFSARSRLGDPDFIDVSGIVQELLSSDYAKKIAKKIDDTRTFSDLRMYDCNETTPIEHGTSHFSIINARGDAISFTSSINYYFGSGQTGARTGMIFNNFMDDFSFKNRAVNYFNLKETPTNYPEPHKRPLSSMSPIIVVDKLTGNVKFLGGAAGGSRIISVLVILLQKFFCCSQDLKELVDAPRFHHQLFLNVLEYEYGVVNGIVEGLKELGHTLERFTNRASIVNALISNKLGIHAIADYRKDGSGVAGN